jgi:hypothetical protein
VADEDQHQSPQRSIVLPESKQHFEAKKRIIEILRNYGIDAYMEVPLPAFGGWGSSTTSTSDMASYILKLKNELGRPRREIEIFGFNQIGLLNWKREYGRPIRVDILGWKKEDKSDQPAIAIESCLSSSVQKAVKNLKETYARRKIIVVMGSRQDKIGDIEIMGLDDFPSKIGKILSLTVNEE